jgi:hypothetical protein
VVVGIAPSEEGSVPDSLSNGARLVDKGYRISWGGSTLSKSATLDMRLWFRASEGDRQEVLALYVLAPGALSRSAGLASTDVDDQGWSRLGGTISTGPACISVPITNGGTYAVFLDSGGPGPCRGLSTLSFTPRVFSPSGSFASTEVAISFGLGRSGPVTVKVYNRAGRLVEEVTTNLRMNAGANVVRWDGRDRDGTEVPDGLYLVTVEALGEKQTSSIAVVR